MKLVLSYAALRLLPPAVAAPAHDPAALRPGIVHLGPGNFHRAHMAAYLQDVMAIRPDAVEWGIVGAGLMPRDRWLVEALRSQDHLYILVERGTEGERAQVISSLVGAVFAADDPAPLLATIATPTVRIVSLTVTEGGYCLDRATRQLDLDHTLIRSDLATPHAPRSPIGVIVEALRRRRDAKQPAFTALSCDNLPHNGAVLRDAVLTMARLRDPALARWIEAEAAFPATMVDRITPVTTDADRADLTSRYGIVDACPVACEPFRQWVVEDRFAAGRPPLEDVGVQLVPDVGPYETMKLRLLNASHHAVAGLGRLLGHATIADCLADPDLRALMSALMDRETGPTIPPVPGIDLAAYKRTLLDRFANPAICDTPARIVADGSPGITLEPIAERLRTGGSVELLTLGLAGWMRCMTGLDEQGGEIVSRHPAAAALRERARSGDGDPAAMLGLTSVFGDIGSHPGMLVPLRRWLGLLHRSGARAALATARRDRTL